MQDNNNNNNRQSNQGVSFVIAIMFSYLLGRLQQQKSTRKVGQTGWCDETEEVQNLDLAGPFYVANFLNHILETSNSKAA